MNSTAKRVLIVDDEPAARAQLREVISGVDNLTVIAEVSDGNAAIAAITEHTPDIVFLDEPTTGLDPQARRSVWDNIEEIKVTYTEFDAEGNSKGNVETTWKVEKGEK